MPDRHGSSYQHHNQVCLRALARDNLYLSLNNNWAVLVSVDRSSSAARIALIDASALRRFHILLSGPIAIL